MPFLNDRVLDLGLNVLDVEANRLDICSAEPTTYTQATSTLTLGNKTSLAIGTPAARTPSGRKVTVAAFSDGTVTASGTVIAWGITDTANSRLLATGTMNSIVVVSGNSFSVSSTALDIGIPAVGGT